MQTPKPMNGQGQGPSRGAAEAAKRLREKIRVLHGQANRRRAEAEASRVLAQAQAPA